MIGVLVEIIAYTCALALIAGCLFVLWHATAAAWEQYRQGSE